MRAICVALAVALAGAGVARAEIHPNDWKAFAQSQLYASDDGKGRWDRRLVEAIVAHPNDHPAALAAFGRAIGVSPELAAGYAETIMVANQETCPDRANGCRLAPGQRLRGLAERYALSEPSGELMRVIGRDLAYGGGSEEGVYVALARRHPRALELVAERFAWAENPAALAGLVMLAPDDPRTLAGLAQIPVTVTGSDDAADGWLEAVIEAGEARAKARGLSVEGQAIYAQALIVRALALGLHEVAVRRYLAYPEAVRAHLPASAADCDAEARTCDQRQTAGYRLADDLAAALWLAGRKEEAQALLARADAAVGRARDLAERQELAALKEAMTPTRADADLFDIFVLGSAADGPAASDELRITPSQGWLHSVSGYASRKLVAAPLARAGYAGMADHLLRDGPYRRYGDDASAIGGLGGDLIDGDVRTRQAAWARLIATGPRVVRSDRARTGAPERSYAWSEGRLPPGVAAWKGEAESGEASEGGLAGLFSDDDGKDPEKALAEAVREDAAEDEPASQNEAPEDDAVAAMHTPNAQAAAAEAAASPEASEATRDATLAAAAAAAAAADAAANEIDEDDQAAAGATATPEAQARARAKLEAEWREERAQAEAAAIAALGLPKGTELPVPATSVIRYERAGAEQVILYQSSDFDLPGEIPAFGVWMARTEGGVWRPGVYLGLQSGFPYIVTPGSAVPILDGDRVRIEVQVREIDPASITFPPVGLRVKRQENGVLLETSLAQLEHDGDNDGLTDAAERRLGLDPARSDSDGDGVTDGRDPLPLVAYDPAAAPGKQALAKVLFQALFNHDAGAIVVGPGREGESASEGIARVLTPLPQAPRQDTVFLIGDPSVFAGASPPFRLMVYTAEQAAALPTGGAPFYPPQIIDLYSSLDGRRHYVTWSASWVGGTFFVDCSKDGEACAVRTLSSWIT